MEWSILGLVIGLAVGIGLMVLYYNRGFSRMKQQLEAEQKQAELDAKRLLSEAEKNGENRKRSLLLQAKEEIQKSRNNLEREARVLKQELEREQSRIDQQEEQLGQRQSTLERLQCELQERAVDLEQSQARLDSLEAQKLSELERVSMLSVEEAKNQVLNHAQETYRHEMALLLRQTEEETREQAEAKAREILATAIQRYSADVVSETTVSVVSLPSDEMKGRIIGREGRNIRAIETITGADLIIDDTPEAVIVSCFDPIRREIAKLTIEKLVVDGRIHPARIEEMAEKARKEVAGVIKREGERACLETGIMGLHPELVKYLGRMYYRYSHGQNCLKHSMEVAWLTGMMAAELGLDADLAKRAGLLHDIGKAADFEMDGSHISIGGDLARRFNEGPVVLNSIVSHHGDVEPRTPIAVLVAAADALSAARPGARRENVETYIKRIQRLEEIALSHPGVEKCYAIKAGREIRVIVEPEKLQDEDMILTAREICKEIEEELSYPGMIKVNMIRETRVSEYAK